MCGICGIVNFNKNVAPETEIRSMMASLKHRGPDDEGIFINNNVGLGFRRLSIIDLSYAGHQPFKSHDGQYVIIFNGEIFNYIELREELEALGRKFYTKTDTEVLLSAYQQWGRDCLHKLNGMWSFVVFDLKSGELFGARDRFGIKPFYYQQTEDRFVFASEIPAILKLCKDKQEVEMQSMFDYLLFNRTDQTEKTFFKSIKKLQHGHCFNITSKGFEIHQWYNLRDNLKKPFANADEFREYFVDSLKLRLRSDVPVGACLSGGLDSSSIASTLLKEFDKKDLFTFSAVYEAGQTGDESYFIHLYNDQIKNMNFIRPDANSLFNEITDFVRIHAEPIPSSGPYAQYKVMELASKNVEVIIDGQGADEMLAGYHDFFGFYFKDLLYHKKINKLISEIFYYLLKHRSLFGLKSFLYFLLPSRIKIKARVLENGYLKKDFINKFKINSVITDKLLNAKSLNDALIDHFDYKLEHLLKWEDYNSMHFSIEARVPFLDHRLVEKILNTPADFIINKGMTKHLLREAMRGNLPEEIRLRKDKIGFDTPQDEWFRTEKWQRFISGILNSSSFANRNIIDENKAKKLYQKHLDRKVNISKEIWKWINLELWFREFID
jgi:asparagine synthase (glutamine-hydrolysing)